jgi:hypothetical protein
MHYARAAKHGKKVNLKFTIEQVTKAQRWSRGIALLFFNLGARWGWVVNATPRPLYPGKDPVPIVQEAGWAPGPVWMAAKNLAPTGIRSADRTAHSE